MRAPEEDETPDIAWLERVEICRAEYEATGSQLAVGDAFYFARRARVPMPEWILEALDPFFERLTITGRLDTPQFWNGKPDARKAANMTPATWPRAIAEAMGFETKGRASNPFEKRFWLYWYRLDMAERVRVLIDGDGLNPSNAYALAAQACYVSDDTVERAWKLLHALARRHDLAEQRERIARLDAIGDHLLRRMYEELRLEHDT